MMFYKTPRWLTAATVGLTLSLSAPAALADDAAANQMFVEAVTALQAAPRGGDADARFDALEKAVAALDKIVSEHPSSALAVQIITGQKIGTVDPTQLKRELASIVANRAAIAAEAAKPFMAQKGPRLRTNAEVAACIAAFECFARLELVQIQKAARARKGGITSRLGALASALYAGGYRGANLDVVLDAVVQRVQRGDRVYALSGMFAIMTVEEGVEASLPRLIGYVEKALQRPASDAKTAAVLNDYAVRIVRRLPTANQATLLTAWRDGLTEAGVAVDMPGGLAPGLVRMDKGMRERIEKGRATLAETEQNSAAQPSDVSRTYSRLARDMAEIGDAGLPEILDAWIAQQAAHFEPKSVNLDLVELLLATGRDADLMARVEMIKAMPRPGGTLMDLVQMALVADNRPFQDAVLALELSAGPDMFDFRQYERLRFEREMRLHAAGLRAGLAKGE